MTENIPTVTVQPASGDTEPTRFLQAVSDAIERSNVLQRDGVVLSLETPALRTDGGSPGEQHTLVHVTCDECDAVDTVTVLKHPKDTGQSEAVIDAHHILAEEHAENTGHSAEVGVSEDDPETVASFAESLREDLAGVEYATDGGAVQPANVWIEDPDRAMALINAIEWSAGEDAIRVLQELLMVVTGDRDAIRLEVADEQ